MLQVESTYEFGLRAGIMGCERASCEVFALHVDAIEWFVIENNTSVFRRHNILPANSTLDMRIVDIKSTSI